MAKEAYYCTVKELNKLGRDAIPAQLRSNTHLIYSSPATLAFNSPGAEGFGVKRAGLAVPDSIMLIVAPGCCGRNTSLISSMREYDNRFFYLMMDETDIVTGRHLKKIPKAVEEICNCCEKRPSVVMICITCVDALLGTDMERVCRKAEERAGLPVRPCYMYALTREGRKPPMVHVRQSLYSLLEPKLPYAIILRIILHTFFLDYTRFQFLLFNSDLLNLYLLRISFTASIRSSLNPSSSSILITPSPTKYAISQIAVDFRSSIRTPRFFLSCLMRFSSVQK